MRSGRRRTATRVRSGRVQKKNNWAADRRDYFAWSQAEIRLDRNDPGVGYRHVLTVPQLRKFVGLLPDWDEIALGLDAIVIDAGHDDQIDHQDGRLGLLWTEAQARAFMLLDVLPHELGHHRDHMTTRSGRLGRGEPFAERYARDALDRIWPIYTQHFEI